MRSVQVFEGDGVEPRLPLEPPAQHNIDLGGLFIVKAFRAANYAGTACRVVVHGRWEREEMLRLLKGLRLPLEINLHFDMASGRRVISGKLAEVHEPRANEDEYFVGLIFDGRYHVTPL